MLTIGKPAPNFTLKDQDGNTHTLSDYKKEWMLLYFYPKDDTPGCAKEACALRDMFPDFRKLKARVFGISADSVSSHAKFAEKFALPFSLLADESEEVTKKYGAWGKKKFMGREYEGILRTSFLINPKGKIVKIYEHVKPETHAIEVLEDLKKMQ